MPMSSYEIEVANCSKVLSSGGTLLYPTDTIWGIGCDATIKDAVSKVYKIKNREEDRSFIILLDDPTKLKDYVEEVPPIVYDIIEAMEGIPLTIIYPKGKNLSENVMGRDHSIAIRIVKTGFCSALLKAFGKPIVSTSANISGEPSPLSFSSISRQLIDRVDHVVYIDEDSVKETRPSRIIKIEPNGMFKVIRD